MKHSDYLSHDGDGGIAAGLTDDGDGNVGDDGAILGFKNRRISSSVDMKTKLLQQ